MEALICNRCKYIYGVDHEPNTNFQFRFCPHCGKRTVNTSDFADRLEGDYGKLEAKIKVVTDNKFKDSESFKNNDKIDIEVLGEKYYSAKDLIDDLTENGGNMEKLLSVSVKDNDGIYLNENGAEILICKENDENFKNILNALNTALNVFELENK